MSRAQTPIAVAFVVSSLAPLCRDSRAQGIVAPGAGPILRSFGGTAIAAPLDAVGALYWNPATLSFLDKRIDIGAEAFLKSQHVESTIPANLLGPGNPPTSVTGKTKSDDGLQLAPAVAAVVRSPGTRWTNLKNPPNATYNVYKAKDDKWFLMVTEPNRWPALVQAIDRPELLTDARFSDATKLLANSAQLAAILDETFSAKPMAYWQDVLTKARVTFGVVQSPADVTRDPQFFENEMIVPIQGAGGNLKSTVSSPIQVRDVTKVPAKRAPELGEHNEEILRELGFSATEIDSLRASGAVPDAKHLEEAGAASKG